VAYQTEVESGRQHPSGASCREQLYEEQPGREAADVGHVGDAPSVAGLRDGSHLADQLNDNPEAKDHDRWNRGDAATSQNPDPILWKQEQITSQDPTDGT
jgi:hypothetical protein